MASQARRYNPRLFCVLEQHQSSTTHMTGSSNSTSKAEIVDMVSLLDSGYRKRSNSASNINDTAALLSIRQNLTYQAAMGVNDLAVIRSNYSYEVGNGVLASLRDLMSVEFGHLRVYRHKQVFIASHRSLEMLIAGLLRVQFHGRQLELPVTNVCGELVDNSRGVSFTWGVGTSVAEAEAERQRQQKTR